MSVVYVAYSFFGNMNSTFVRNFVSNFISLSESRGFITAEDSDDEMSIDKARPRRRQRLKSESGTSGAASGGVTKSRK